MLRWSLVFVGLLSLDRAYADIACVKHEQSSDEIADAEKWKPEIVRIAESIGLFREFTIVPCDFSKGVVAYVAPSGIPDIQPGSEYIIYQPSYLRTLTGGDSRLVSFVLGHEIGHLINNHLLASDEALSHQFELEADYMGACALVRSGGTFADVEEIISRLRTTGKDGYPSQNESLFQSAKAFEVCGPPVPDYSKLLLPRDGVFEQVHLLVVLQWAEWLKVFTNHKIILFCESPGGNLRDCADTLDKVTAAFANAGILDERINAESGIEGGQLGIRFEPLKYHILPSNNEDTLKPYFEP